MNAEAAGDAGDYPCSGPTLDAWSWIARARAAAQRAVQSAEPTVREADDEPELPENAPG
ncbi:hypothetical protein [Thioalkalivibrio sp. XN279]|uniref:hypothetical protein n=1 Tax=Thioalkalivibrio sp. XN279 TaxID=2714953 RepID=UPI00140B3E05|nr:hypothetical protein [Thioalkalivibrio sp. XN279]NHA14071.1 hypothetical protein [Thioalkalivibrio sp. XN279]